MVPIREMVDVMRVVKETNALRSKMWVRIKRGIFKDDLALVCYAILCSAPLHTGHIRVSVALELSAFPYIRIIYASFNRVILRSHIESNRIFKKLMK